MTLENQIVQLMADKMELEVESFDSDLFEDGVLDSLSYVRLVVELQQAFGITLSLAQIDIDQFRTVHQIAAHLSQHEPVLAAV